MWNISKNLLIWRMWPQCDRFSQTDTGTLLSSACFCNALLSSLPKKYTSHLDLFQNSAVLTETGTGALSTPSYLSASEWILKSFLSVAYEALYGSSYTSDMLLPYEPPRSLRSSGRDPLIKLKVRTESPVRHLCITVVCVSGTASVCKDF